MKKTFRIVFFLEELFDSKVQMHNAIALPFFAEQTIAQAIYLSGQFIPPSLCSGIGQCGQCRVKILLHCPQPTPEDFSFFSPAEIEQGWRLGCHHYSAINQEIEVEAIPQSVASVHIADKLLSNYNPNIQKACSLAIDLGTTSLHWVAIGVDKEVIEQGKCVNPQMGAGSDVISRLSYTEKKAGQEILTTLTRQNIGAIGRFLCQKGYSVNEIVLAANPTMTAITLGISTSMLAKAPYALPITGNCYVKSEDLPDIWVPPLLSAFVGGDITAGFVAVQEKTPKYPYLLADMGTNGEFLLVLSPTKSYATSVALGPALEGIGLRFGTEARQGAITRFSLSPTGIQPHYFQIAGQLDETSQGNFTETKGISGTGYVSLLHILVKAGALTREGAFTVAPILHKQEKQNRQKVQKLLHSLGEPFFALPELFYLTASDVEELLKVKAAFSAGVYCLLHHANISFNKLQSIFIAGALGEHIDIAALEGLGFIATGAGKRTHVVGNASLFGAVELAISRQKREKLGIWAEQVEVVDLTSSAIFQQSYLEHMHFSFKSNF